MDFEQTLEEYKKSEDNIGLLEFWLGLEYEVRKIYREKYSEVMFDIADKKNNYTELVNIFLKNYDSRDREFELSLLNRMCNNEEFDGLFCYLTAIEHFRDIGYRHYYLGILDLCFTNPEKIQALIIEKFIKKDKANQLSYFALLLWIESVLIIKQQYSDIDFKQYPEIDEVRKKLWKSNSEHLVLSKYAQKLIKSHKCAEALYILNNFGGFYNVSDAKMWCDSYIDTFVKMERYDILAKYYETIDVLGQNVEFLQHITKYFIAQKDFDKARGSLSKISHLSSTSPFVKVATEKIDRLSSMQRLASEGIDMENINDLSGKDFEELLISRFQQYGFKASGTSTTGDFGADIIIDTHDDTRFIIQCKRFKSKVNLKAVQEVVGAMSHYSGDIGIVITSSGFLPSATTLAESNGVELWDGGRLMKFLGGDLSFSQMAEWVKK